jgi:uncharacterized protein YfeS
VALFLKDGAVGIKLTNKILKYLSKIRELAKLQRLELLKNIYALDSNNEKYKKNAMTSKSIKYHIKILQYTLIILIKLITKRVSDKISSRR